MQALRTRPNKLAMGAVTVAALLAAAACSSSGSSTGNTSAHVSSVTIGEVTDLSGVASAYGVPENEGAQIAVQQINAAGGIKSLGGAKLVLKTFDTASNPDNGQTEASDAVSAKVSAVFGGEISDTVLAGINVTQRAGVPWVDVGGTANEIHERGYSTVFQMTHDSTQFATEWLDVAKLAAQKVGITSPTVAIAYSESSYGEELLSAFDTANASAGMKVVTNFGYPLTTTDFSAVAARLAASSANIIFNMGYPADGLALAKLFATQSKPKAKVILLAGSDAEDVTGQLKTQADGTFMNGDLAPGVTGLPAAFSTFYQQFEAKFHSAPNSQSNAGYVAVRFIAAALEKAKSASPSAVATALHGVTLTQSTGNIYPEPTTLSFASDGTLNEAPFYAAQIVGGVGKLVYPTSVSETSITPYSG
jgi:branched-chain amino acid transport system substrate-binding protein